MTSFSTARRAAIQRVSPIRIGVFSLLLFALICIELYLSQTALITLYDQLLEDYGFTDNKGWQKIVAWFVKELRFWLPFITIAVFQYATYRGYDPENGIPHKEKAWQVGIVTVRVYGGLLPYVAVLSRNAKELAAAEGTSLPLTEAGLEDTLLLRTTLWFVRLAIPLLLLLVYHASTGYREAREARETTLEEQVADISNGVEEPTEEGAI